MMRRILPETSPRLARDQGGPVSAHRLEIRLDVLLEDRVVEGMEELPEDLHGSDENHAQILIRDARRTRLVRRRWSEQPLPMRAIVRSAFRRLQRPPERVQI